MTEASNEQRYAFFLHSFGGGGAEKILVTLANGIAERGMLVDIVAAKAEGPVLQLVSSKVNVIDFGCTRTISAIFPLARYLKNARPTALVSSVIHANIYASISHRLARSQSNLVLRVAGPEHTSSSNIPWYKRRILKTLTRWAYRYTDSIVSVSHELEKSIRTALELDKDALVEVIYNPIATDFAEASEQAIEKPLNGDPETPLIIGVGRLIEPKGFRDLIAAVEMVSRQRPVRLAILGDGPDREKLLSLVESLGMTEQVTLPGFVSNPLPYVKSSAVFVLSSHLEGLPNALIEAIVCGVPVVATDCPTGTAEVLEYGRIGALVPVSDIEKMADAILDVLEGRVIEFDRQKWRSQFETDVIIDQYLKVMNRLS